jgi:uncharacterized membrane protein
MPVERWWDGVSWTGHVRSVAGFAPPTRSDAQSQVGLIAGVLALVLAVIGVVLSQQSVSVVSGGSIVWVGAALAIGAAVLALSIPRVRTFIKILTVIAAIIGVASGVYVNHQLDQKRKEIQQIFNDIPSYTPPS